VTVLSLLSLTTPADFADWYRIGADYVLDVAEGMEFDVGAFPERATEATAAMRAGRVDVRPELARSIAADLLADAVYSAPFCEWMPLWYELGLAPGFTYAAYRLRRVASQYAASLDRVAVPRFSRPRDVLVEGRPATAWVSGFGPRFVYADAILHVEWFVHVARESGIEVPQSLVDRTLDETAAFYASRGDLSPTVRRFQRHLFLDDRWVRRIDETYGLDSRLFGVWERLLTDARRELAAESPGSPSE
jgi:hypothetical protein